MRAVIINRTRAVGQRLSRSPADPHKDPKRAAERQKEHVPAAPDERERGGGRTTC
jgi:hypothetical protein